jgi:N-acetylglucosamine kinase-like BadF-type ATPase
MTDYFLGADVGSSKTHVLISDAAGRGLGFGQAGPGNHETVGYAGLEAALAQAVQQALAQAGISRDQIAASGFGVAGFDWPSEKEATLQSIRTLGLSGLVEAVNDTIIGLMAGSEAGWGIGVVSGTGCNCRGWDQVHQREGMVTGAGLWMGEGAGASELLQRAVMALSHTWSGRGPQTRLAQAFLQKTSARDLSDLLEGLINERYTVQPDFAPQIFRVAAAGDAVAQEVVQWAASELAEIAKAVIRQLDFQALEFDVVMIGSMFNAGPPLIEPMQANISAFAPGARFVRLSTPPVIGGVLLALEIAGRRTSAVRQQLLSLAETIRQ